MEDILKQLADYARVRVRKKEEKLPLLRIREEAEALPADRNSRFEQALHEPGMSFICECKRASPSKGLIAPEFPYVQIAKEYEAAGAAAISCLTEPKWFLGSDDYLREIAGAVSVPVLRKDFTVSPYMIYEAKLLGAGIILLIAAILTDQELSDYFQTAERLGLSVLFEAHDPEEVRRSLAAGARIIGVNNRDLRNFKVDYRNCLRLRRYVPGETAFIAESGISSHKEVQELNAAGVDGVLIGESLMTAPDKAAMIRKLRDGGVERCFEGIRLREMNRK